MKLYNLKFTILDALADGSEPFSMIVQDVIEEIGITVGTADIARELCKLISDGLISEQEQTRITAESLSTHYINLKRELSNPLRPFYYSQGEYFFELTPRGREFWSKCNFL